jgi:hypothetical protein
VELVKRIYILNLCLQKNCLEKAPVKSAFHFLKTDRSDSWRVSECPAYFIFFQKNISSSFGIH